MKKSADQNFLCNTFCKSFRCSERMLRIIRKKNNKLILCKMVEDDVCIGYKCKFAFCSYHPPSLDLSTGICGLKKKKTIQSDKKTRRHEEYDNDPLKYRNMLNKKMKKNFNLKDFY